ncbi:hypothetical protein F5Y11DRAFT_76191 [Daldinia sp. FL1419]|nr:hypothetical protein F5Y11DRAFT_76191 [Daldinia sp. FL1419]
MGPFAVPVPGYRLGAQHRHNKHKKTNENQESEEAAWTGSEWGTPSSRLPSGSINPLSHTPDTLRQFAIAGLSPEEELPSKVNPLFPHKSIRPEGKERRRSNFSKDDTANIVKKDEGVTSKQYSERLKHISTITAILHRCLGESDIARAKRAFGLLVQTKDVDIRQAGLWAVGSEILMRDGGSEDQTTHGQLQSKEKELRRWGSASNIEKVKSYFENLIQQHPHDPHRPHLTSALDFWPALFGIEIYNIDAEMRVAMYHLRQQEHQHDQEEDGGGYGLDADLDMTYSDEAFEARRDTMEGARREETYAARDEVRLRALAAAEAVARQMDQVMENALYGAHRGLLRLRAHLALFVGDLCLPARLVDDHDHIIKEEGKRKKKGKNAEDGLRARAETAEDHAALARRRDEHDRARMLFRKVMDGKGESEQEGGADAWVQKFVGDDGNEMDEGGSNEW